MILYLTSSLILLDFWIYISFLFSLCENDAIMVGMKQIFIFFFYLSWVKERGNWSSSQN